MRFASVFVAVVVLAIPTLAQAGQTYASYTCAKQVPCPTVLGLDADAYVKAGNECMKTGMGYSSKTGFFDPIGLDVNRCLTSIPGTFPKGIGTQLTPMCCVVKADDTTCVFHCDLVAQ